MGLALLLVLDYELYYVLLVGACAWTLLQALAAVVGLRGDARYGAAAFLDAHMAACAPYLSDSFDTLRDTMLGALCLKLPYGWHVLGYASLAYLVFIHIYMLLDMDKAHESLPWQCKIHISASQCVLRCALVVFCQSVASVLAF